jgi:hypothetical protein
MLLWKKEIFATSAAKAADENAARNAALKRCATQTQSFSTATRIQATLYGELEQRTFSVACEGSRGL